MDLAYNALLLAFDIWVVRAARPYDARRVALAAGAFALAASALAWELGGGTFGALRLLCYGVFVHGFATASIVAIRSRSQRVVSRAMFAVAAVLALIGVDAFWVEPQRLTISRVHLTSQRLHRSLDIVVLADIQTDRVGDHERAALSAAVREKPDIVLFAGDYVQVRRPELGRERRALRDAIREVGLTAPLGVYAVRGNVDPDGWEEIFDDLHTTTFDRTRDVDVADVRITGLGVDDSFDSKLRVAASDRFHIAFGHAPNFALGDVQADLLVAGHTHGGQVRLPWFGPLLTFSTVPRRWAAGLTALSGGRALVVSRGVGLERGPAPRLRFLCPPEIVVIRVDPG
jgi:predicted MPP superfamily phosphohydrolase